MPYGGGGRAPCGRENPGRVLPGGDEPAEADWRARSVWLQAPVHWQAGQCASVISSDGQPPETRRLEDALNLPTNSMITLKRLAAGHAAVYLRGGWKRIHRRGRLSVPGSSKLL